MANPSPIMISAGGTGGGVYPALAVAEALRQRSPNLPLHFIGSVGGMESGLVPRDLFAGYHEVYSGPLNGVGVLRALASAIKILIGTLQAWLVVNRIRPAVLFLTGGWATFPAALASWLQRVPIVIFLPDLEPARAIKLMSRLARLILVTSSESAAYFDKGVQVKAIGYPLRAELMRATKDAAVEHFGLDPARKTLLVFGGSRGARSLNNALAAILPDLLAQGLQVIHVSGELDWATVKARYEALPEKERASYHAYPYLRDDMGLALAGADLVVSRAGASVLGEFPYFGLPSILVPYPFAWRYQKVNADWLVSRGAAIRLDDEKLGSELLPTIRGLIGDTGRLASMHTAAQGLSRANAAEEIAAALMAFTQKS